MAFGLSEIIRWGLARLTGQQRTNGGTAVAALTSSNVLLDANGAAVLTKSGTATTFPGPTRVPNGSSTEPSISAISNTGTGLYFPFGVDVAMSRNGNQFFNWAGVTATFTGRLGLVSAIGAASGVFLSRPADNILRLSNDAAAQRFQVFNTGDSANGEWFDIDWQTTPNVATIGARAAGTGTLRPVTAIGNWTFNSQIVLPFAGGVGSTTGAGDGEWYLVAASINRVSMSDYGLTNGANIPVAWSSSATPNRALRDVAVGRNAAGVLEINNGTAGQFRDLRLRNLIASGTSRVIPVPVGSLPSASASGAGAEAIVNDALSPAWGATVAGGGAVTVGVRSNGTNWIVF